MNRISGKRIHMKKLIYKKHQEHFMKSGFSYQVACELIPVTQLRIWDMFGLFCCAKQIPNGGAYLEIGSKWGGSLRCALRASQTMHHKIRLTAIEAKPNHQLINFCIANKVRLIKGYSQNEANKIADDSIDMLFIDGLHSYKQISCDIKKYWSKVKDGGFLMGHDHEKRFPGIAQAMRESFGKNYIILQHSTIFLKKKEISR